MLGHGLSLSVRLTTTSLLTNGAGYGISGGPSGLEIKATCDTIDIENLSSEINAGEVFAFQGVRIHTRQVDTTTGDKLILEGRATCYLVLIVAQGIGQTVQFLLVQILPTVLGTFA